MCTKFWPDLLPPFENIVSNFQKKISMPHPSAPPQKRYTFRFSGRHSNRTSDVINSKLWQKLDVVPTYILSKSYEHSLSGSPAVGDTVLAWGLQPPGQAENAQNLPKNIGWRKRAITPERVVVCSRNFQNLLRTGQRTHSEKTDSKNIFLKVSATPQSRPRPNIFFCL